MTTTTATPRETDELRPVTVTVNGTAVTTGVEFSIAAWTVRPATWTPAVVRDGKTLIRVAALTPGTWRVWARVSRGDEIAVLDCGPLYIT